MAEHSNVGRIRKGLELRKAAQPTDEALAFLWDLFSDQVVWHGSGDNPFAGDFVGKQAVFEAFGRVETGGSFTREVEGVFADNDYAIAIVQNTAHRGDKHMVWHEVMVFGLDADGRIRTFRGIHEDQDAVDELWATPVAAIAA